MIHLNSFPSLPSCATSRRLGYLSYINSYLNNFFQILQGLPNKGNFLSLLRDFLKRRIKANEALPCRLDFSSHRDVY